MITPATEILNQKGTPMFNSDLFANRPAAGIAGRIFISTDTKELYRDTGTTWELLSAGSGGTVTGSGSATQVAFWTGSSAISGNNDLWWDNVNDYLGIKTNSPISELDVVGQGYFHPSVTAAANSGWASSYAFTTATIPATTFSNLGNVFCGATGINSMTYNGDATFQQANVPAAIIGNNIFRFGSSGLTISLNQGSGLRAFSALTAFNQVQSNFTGTISHLAGVHVLAPFASNQSMNVTNYYGLLINNATERTAFTITNRWGVYQDGSSDTNYFAGRTLIRSNVDNGNALQVTGTANITNLLGVGPAGSNPNANIDVTAAINTTPEIRITGQGTGSARLRLRTLAINACEFHYSNGLNIFDTSLGVNTMVFSSTGNVGIGTPSPTYRLNISGSSNALRVDGTNSATDVLASFAGRGVIGVDAPGVPNGRFIITDAGNVGIGSTTATYRLTLRNDVAASTDLEPIALGLYNNLDGGSAIYFSNNVGGQSKISFGVESTGAGTNDTYLGFSTGVNTTLSERMRITSGGNVGIGVTPSAWGSTVRALQFENGGSIASNQSTQVSFNNNVYSVPGTNDYYISSTFASRYIQFQGQHIWSTAPSGTAGSAITFTQAMTLDASGNLYVGATQGYSSGARFIAQNGAIIAASAAWNNNNAGGAISMFCDNSSYGTIWALANGNSSWGNIALAPIGGNIMIGSTTNTGNKLYLNGSLRIDGQRSGTAGGNSGQHLIITLDGIQYKIALLNP